MKRRNCLGEMKINKVRHLIVKTPVLIKENAEIEEVMSKLNHDSATRNIFVVNDQNKLIGSLCMNTIIQYLFPMGAILSKGITETSEVTIDFHAKKVSEIMDKQPFSVKDDSSLAGIATTMIMNKLHELPVVDDDMTLIGQINANEIIQAYTSITIS